MPYNSGFEAAVGSFLQNYAAMRGLKQQDQESALRKRQADRADQMQQIQMGEAGYDVLPMPKVEQPPGQSFFQRVGHFLAGGDAEPGSIVMKTHPSVHEQDVASEHEFQTSRDQSVYNREMAVEKLRASINAATERMRQDREDARNNADNATRLKVAGMENAPRMAATQRGEREALADSAVEAAGGDYMKAGQILATNRPGDAVRVGMTDADLQAAAQRFADRRAQLTREGIESREGMAAIRAGSFMPPPGVAPPPGRATSPSPPLVKLAPLAESDKQAARSNPAFAAHLQALGYKPGVDF